MISIAFIRSGAPGPPGEHFPRKSALFAKILHFEQEVLVFMEFRYFGGIPYFSRPGRKTYIITVVYFVFFHDFCSKTGISRNFMNYATFCKNNMTDICVSAVEAKIMLNLMSR